MEFPDDRRYTKDHEWARRDGDLVVIGITAYAAEELGAVTYVELTTVGDNLDVGASFGEIESHKVVEDLYAPMAGEVVEINAELVDMPELVNDDTYGRGWIVKMRSTDDLESLMSADAYREHVG